MPTYEYVCTHCQNEWEEIQKNSEPALEVCPKCAQSTAKRQISGGNFILKGGGWYADLYSSAKKPNGKSEGKSEGSGEKKSEGSGEKKSESAAPKGDAGGGGSSSSGSSGGSSGSSAGGSSS